MFKKLKDKIAEEVKQSPLKSVQQLAQAVVSPSSRSVFEPSSSNDKFCIEEADIEEHDVKDKPTGGFTSVTLTGQTTSPVRHHGSFATERDNLFTVFESQPTNFHVQSDWESASEVEDRYSQVEHISKDSLYEAYRKVNNRYNKMRNKYQELVTHYRQLEREKDKAKTVLSETQDKALLRISELKEQCLLEQQAKAHLEEALRNELEERDHVINTLKTKVQYLKGVTDDSKPEHDNLIDFTDSLSVSESTVWFEEQLKKLDIFLENKTVQIEDLKCKLEDMKNRDCDEDKSDSEVSAQRCDNDYIINQTVKSLIDELAKEVKSLRKDTLNHLELEMKQRHICKENSLFDGAAHNSYSARNNSNDHSDGNNLRSQQSSEPCVKELTQQLSEERLKSEQLKTEMESLSNMFEFVRDQLKTVNKNFNEENTSLFNLPVFQPDENALIQELQCCITNLFNTKSTLEKVIRSKIQLENELSVITKGKNNEGNASLETIHREDNKQLKVKLLELQNENSNMVVKIESLIQEIGDAKYSNQELNDCIKKLEDLLTVRSEECKKEKTALETATLHFDSEKNILENKIITIGNSFDKLEKDHVLLVKENETISSKLALLREEYNHVSKEKDVLESNLNEILNESVQRKKDYEILLNIRDKLTEELSSLKTEHSIITSEKKTCLGKISDLEKEFENIKNNYTAVVEENKKLLDQITLLQKENDIICDEKMTIQNQFNKLEKYFESNKQEQEESSKRFSDEIFLLKSNIDELHKEKQMLLNRIDHFSKVSEDKGSEYLLSIEIQKKLSEELAIVKEEKENIGMEKLNLHQNIVRLEEALKTNEKEQLQTINKLNDEIDILKNKFDVKDEENKSMQSKIDKLLTNFKKIKKEHTIMVESKNTLTNESIKLQKEYNELVCILNDTRAKLESQEQTCEELDKKLKTQSDLFKAKCKDAEEKYQENIHLKTDAENLLNKINNLNSRIEHFTQGKSFILNQLLLNLAVIKNIRQSQRNLLGFVLQFRVDIMKEMNIIKVKVDNDMMYRINELTQENEVFKKQAVEFDCKNKQDIDSYNSKIKNLRTELQNTNEMTNHQRHLQECSASPHRDKINCDLKEWMNEVGEGQDRCRNLETNLNQAVAIMKSLNDCLNRELVSHETQTNRKNLSEKQKNECSGLEQVMLAVNSFLNKWEFSFKDEHFKMKPPLIGLESDNFGELEKLELRPEIETEQRFMSSNNSSCQNEKPETRKTAPLEIRQLKEEIRLKDDIIKKLECFVEENEQMKNTVLSDNVECNKEAAVLKNDIDHTDLTRRLIVLEQENETLRHDIVEIKENCDTEIKRFITDYEVKYTGGGKMFNVKEMKEQIENLQQDLEERGDAFEKLYEEHQQSVKSKDEEIEQLRKSYEKEMREQDKKWRSCLDRRLAEEEARHQREVDDLTREWTLERKELESTSRLALSAVESGSNSSTLLRHQIQALTMQLTELQSTSVDRSEGCHHEGAVLRGYKSCADCTEMEYLRNILYKYMMGKEPLVLAKVLCALMKFDENQTKDIVLKEEQKITIFGQWGML